MRSLVPFVCIIHIPPPARPHSKLVLNPQNAQSNSAGFSAAVPTQIPERLLLCMQSLPSFYPSTASSNTMPPLTQPAFTIASHSNRASIPFRPTSGNPSLVLPPSPVPSSLKGSKTAAWAKVCSPEKRQVQQTGSRLMRSGSWTKAQRKCRPARYSARLQRRAQSAWPRRRG